MSRPPIKAFMEPEDEERIEELGAEIERLKYVKGLLSAMTYNRIRLAVNRTLPDRLVDLPCERCWKIRRIKWRGRKDYRPYCMSCAKTKEK